MALLQATSVCGDLTVGGCLYGDGSTLSNVNNSSTYTTDLLANCVTLGQGGGDIDSNTALGECALSSNTTGVLTQP